MSRRIFVLFAFVVFSPGCVPMTEPVGDIDKAEVDELLVGTWEFDPKGLVPNGKDKPEPEFKIALAPEVKGNPKGLMQLTSTEAKDKKAGTVWFFVSTVGKEKYVNLCMSRGTKKKKEEFVPGDAQFDKEGEYAKWAKSDDRWYLILHYTTTKGTPILKFGDSISFEKLMKDEKIEKVQDEGAFYKTPPGWLTKYLEKNGPEALYGKSVLNLVKKK